MIESPGQHDVARSDLIDLVDEAREKVVPVLIHSPRHQGRFPVVLFSHGVGASPYFATELPRYWASRGYLCITPAHADSPEVRERLGQEQVWADPVGRVRRAFGVLHDWQNCFGRVADLSLVIDCLPQLEPAVTGLLAEPEPERIGVAGHSYGAYIAQLAGGAEIQLPHTEGLTRLADSRICAVIQLAGQGSGRRGLTRASWRRFNNPMLSVTGTRDRMTPRETLPWKKESFLLSPPGGKVHVVLEGADHNSFGNLDFEIMEENAFGQLGPALAERLRKPEFRRDYERYLKVLKVLTAAFWDVYLKHDAQQEERLRGGFPEVEFDVEFEIQSR